VGYPNYYRIEEVGLEIWIWRALKNRRNNVMGDQFLSSLEGLP